MKRLFASLCAASLCALTASCGGGSDDAGSQGATGWTRQAAIGGACCSYSSLVFTDKGLSIYSNSTGGDTADDTGSLFLYEGSVGAGVGPAQRVLRVSDPRDAYIRTSAVVTLGGKHYALLYTGIEYPTSGGFSPSWATSDDGKNWTWHGFVSPYPRNLSSGQALTVDAQGNFRAWIDSVGGTLREMRSSDGIHWKDFGDIWPASVKSSGVFPNAVRTPKGTMISAVNTWPGTKVAVLWQCHGQPDWTVLEEDSPIRGTIKGTNLSWDGHVIHAYVDGHHWTRPEPACPA